MGVLSIESMTGSGALGAVQTGWSISESATSVNITEQTGGTGSASFGAVKTPTSKFVIDNLITLDTDGLGALEGIIGDTSITGDSVSVTVAPTLSLLNAERSAPPTGEQALSAIFASYVALVTNQIVVDYQATSDPLRIYPGWSGSVWNFLQQLCAFNGVEMTASGDSLVVRDVGSVEYELGAKVVPTFAASVASTGRSIDVVVQNTALVASLPGSKYNYSENPSVETNATGWSYFLTSGTVATVGRSTISPLYGTASYRCAITSTVAPSYVATWYVRNEFDVSSIPTGEPCSASILAKVSRSTPYYGYTEAQIGIFWKNSSGSTIGGYTPAPVLLPNGGGSAPSVEQTLVVQNVAKPSGATKAVITISFPGYSASATENVIDGDVLQVDCAMFTNGSIIPFFDGNSAGATWSGATNNSSSSTLIPSENDFYNAFADNNTIYSVSSGESVTTTVQTSNYPTYLAQPVVSDVFPIAVGTYCVSGADNLPVVPAEWIEYGGNVSVAISEVPGAIDLTLSAPPSDIPGVPGPYTLSVSDGSSQYATLSIAGIGVTTKPETLNLLTGASPEKTTVEVAATVNSPFCITKEIAYDHSSWAVAAAAGPNTTLRFNVPTSTLSGLGLTEGAMFTHEDARYRIISATIGHTITSISAVRHTTIGEMDQAWVGQTLGDFDTLWSGYSAGDVNIAPLRVS